jgi:hypothetical protein
MTMPSRRFDPAEIRGGSAGASEDELAIALRVARDLEAVAASADAVHPGAGFGASVMSAVAREPAPHGAGLLAPLRAHPGVAGLVESVRDAWALVLSGGRPFPARATALAYVLAIAVLGASLTGAAAFGTAGALGLLGPRPSTVEPAPSPSESPEPSASPEPSPSTSDEPSSEPSESPGATESAEPSETETTSAAGGGGSAATPRPTAAPRATETLSPTSSDDHGGSSDSPHPSASGESN